jgi:hypothetical protein
VSTRTHVITCCLALLAVMTGVDKLTAQVNCIPQAYGVPTMGGQPPLWWDGDNDLVFPEFPNENVVAGPHEMERLHDPRWRGGLAHSFLGGHGEFRALYDNSKLYLSWRIKVDPSLDEDGDAIFFGAKQESGPATVIGIVLKRQISGGWQARPHPGDTPTYYNIRVDRWTGSGWNTITDPALLPAWIKATTRSWSDWNGLGTNATWAFQIVVPISTDPDLGLDLGDAFDMWYTAIAVNSDGVAEYHWPDPEPDGRPNISTTTAGSYDFPHPTATSEAGYWGTLSKVSAPSGMTCGGDVALSAANVGTGNIPTSKIKRNANNTFFASPENIRATPIPAGAIMAKFYLANWGTAMDYSSIGDITTAWQEIQASTQKTNSADIPHGPSDASNDIRFDEQGVQLPNTADHQCMLVVLSGTECECPADDPPPCPACEGFAPLVFRNQSAYRNMDFDNASTFRREGEVSVRGLDPYPGSDQRDVYLWVETNNLESQDVPGLQMARELVPGEDTIYVSESDTVTIVSPDTVRFDSLRFGGPAIVVRPGSDTVRVPPLSSGERGGALRTAWRGGLLEQSEIDELMPTFRVHAYHATGDSAIVRGRIVPVLRAQTSFGYWLDHEGELKGWDYGLEGAQLVRLAPYFYRIAVPNESFATIVTKVQAIEPPAPYPSFAFGIHTGVAIPVGSFSEDFDPGINVFLGAYYRVDPKFSVTGIAGYNGFNSRAEDAGDFYVISLSANLKYLVNTAPLTAYINGGPGAYIPQDAGAKVGLNVGGGLNYELTGDVVLELGADYYSVFDSVLDHIHAHAGLVVAVRG